MAYPCMFLADEIEHAKICYSLASSYAGEAIGQDNEYVFREVLGLSDADYAGLVEIGAIEPMES